MAKNGAVAQESRLVAIDWRRGVVMVLRTLDHWSGAFNAGRLFTDGVWLDRQPLPAAQFLTRWVSHISAPTFVFSRAPRWRSRTRAQDFSPPTSQPWRC